MREEFEFDAFLSHSSKDKDAIRDLAERLREDNLKVWFDEWHVEGGDIFRTKIDDGIEQSRILVGCMSTNAFESDWFEAEINTFLSRDPLNKEKRFIPLLIDDCEIKGMLKQFNYVDWRGRSEESYTTLVSLIRRYESLSYGREGPARLLNMDQLRRNCESQTRDEILQTAKRKYIPDLYVNRQTEHQINCLLPTDAVLSNRLMGARQSIEPLLRKRRNDNGAVLERLLRQIAEAKRTASKAEIYEKYRRDQLDKRNVSLRLATYFSKESTLLLLGELARVFEKDGIAHVSIVKCLTAQTNFDEDTVAKSRIFIEQIEKHFADRYAGFSNSDLKGLAGFVANRGAEIIEADKEYERVKATIESEQLSIEQTLSNIDIRLDQILASGQPCDGIHRAAFKELLTYVTDLGKFVSDIDGEGTLRQFEDILRQSHGQVVVLVDRAGGGKTNVLCHLALERAKSEPVLFLSGRRPIESADSLLTLILRRLGWDSTVSREAFLVQLSESLNSSRSTLTIYVDGINENRFITQFNTSFSQLLNDLSTLRVRFVVSCRDIYWTFFANESWTDKVAAFIRGTLYQFSEQEQELAIRAYLKHFNIVAEFGRVAKEKCRLPLMLRFFCEAYGSVDGDPHDLGTFLEIRLKPLFDEYWDKKIQNIEGRATGKNNRNANSVVLDLAVAMLESNSASVELKLISSLTGIDDLTSQDSVYVQLLNEDIIFDEEPISATRSINGDQRKVLFVYEEFMEYAVAKGVFHRLKSTTEEELSIVFESLNSKKKQFVNVLGVGEYLVAFCLSEGLLSSAFHLLCLMAIRGDEWESVVSNVFTKYDECFDMVTDLDGVTGVKDVSRLHHIVRCLGKQSRLCLSEVAAAIGFRVLTPDVFSMSCVREFVVEGESNFRSFDVIELSQCMLISNRELARPLLRVVARELHDQNINAARKGLWAAWKGEFQLYNDKERSILIDALAECITASTRRTMLIAFCCNGLFDIGPAVRAVVMRQARKSPVIRSYVSYLESHLRGIMGSEKGD